MLLTTLLAAAPAQAIIRLPAAPVAEPIEDSEHDPATHCSRKPKPGMTALQRWLEANVRGVSWGTYRCEKWGKTQGDRREAMIWDCGYWGAGMTRFEPYPACFNHHGTRRKRVDPSVAHRNHIHIGLTKAGAARRTSFWSVAR